MRWFPWISLAIVIALASGAIAGGEDLPKSADAAKAKVAKPKPYPHKSFRKSEHGRGGQAYWLYEPTEPTPEKAPVVVFFHGWLAMNPGVYGAWIDHLVRSGRIVIAPRYQKDWATPPEQFLPNSLAAVHDALDVLTTAEGRVRPDLSRFALLGHSAGGNLAAQVAAVAAAEHLPEPKAVVSVTPGEVREGEGPPLDRIPKDTLLVVIATEHDWIVGDRRARQIFLQGNGIPASRKRFVLYRTDRHGWPPLVADHVTPTASLAELDTGEGPFHAFQISKAQTDAFDRLGLWRLADLTLEAADQGHTLDEATRQNDLIRNLGHWPDGRPIMQPVVADDLDAIPRVLFPNGLRVLNRPAVAASPKADDKPRATARSLILFSSGSGGESASSCTMDR